MDLYHYISKAEHEELRRRKILIPTSPFNPRIKDDEWKAYIKRFGFPVSRHYICTFFKEKPESWVRYGLFDLLMEEFAGGDFLLKITTDDDPDNPILVRDHKFHSPREYGCSPEVWRNRKIRDSRPDLRDKWYESAIKLSDYNGSYICPEVLIPFSVPLDRIKIEQR